MASGATNRFLNLPADKADRVIEAAVAEFGRHGYQHANTNRIAKAAGISVGALFKYFPRKEDLFRHVIHVGAQVIESSIRESLDGDGSALDKLEKVLQIIVQRSRLQRDFVQLYHEITTVGNQQLISDFALQLEGFSSSAYIELLTQAQADGEIRDDVDPAMLAFCIDNVFISLQYSYACDYYIDRFKLYRGDIDDEGVIDQVMAFVRSGVAAR